MKSVVPSELARRDAEEAITYYLQAGGARAALGFVDALEKAYAHIARHPATGSLRYAHELDLPGLRMWPLNGYPHLVFYVEGESHLDVWRVLHGERDAPGWMRGD